MKDENQPARKRREHPLFIIFVHIGYAVLIASVIGWIVYVEFILSH